MVIASSLMEWLSNLVATGEVKKVAGKVIRKQAIERHATKRKKGGNEGNVPQNYHRPLTDRTQAVAARSIIAS